MGFSIRTVLIRAGVVAAVILASAAAAQAADNIRVKVKRGTLYITGDRDASSNVEIIPTATGLRIDGDIPGDDTINGENRPFITDEPIRDWKLRFTRTRTARVFVRAPADGIPPLQPRSVSFVCGRDGRFSAEGLEVRGKLDVDMRRVREGAGLTLVGVSVSNAVALRSGTARTEVLIDNCSLGGGAKLFARNFGAPVVQANRVAFTLTDNFLSRLSLGVAMRSPGFHAPIVSRGNEIGGNASLKGDIDISSEQDTVKGTLTVDAGRGSHLMEFTGLGLSSKATFKAGSTGDTIRLTDSVLGRLKVIGGRGGDTLETLRVTLDASDKFLGGKGRDTWSTSGDGTEIKTRSVESIEPGVQ